MACRCGSKFASKTNLIDEYVEPGMGIVDVRHGSSKRQSIGNYLVELGDSGDFPVIPYIIGGVILLYLTKKFVQA